MAFKHSLLFLGLLFLATTSISHGFYLNGARITQVKIAGTIYCSSTGNFDAALSTCPPLANVKVTLVSTSPFGTSVCAEAVTDANGFFTLVLDTLNILDFLLSNYYVSVDLSVGLPCPYLPHTGHLKAPFALHHAGGGVAEYGLGELKCVP